MNLEDIRMHSNISWSKPEPVVIPELTPDPFTLRQCAILAANSSLESYHTKGRKRKDVYARFLVANYRIKHTKNSLRKIGYEVSPENPKDHATVLYYKREFTKFMESKDPVFTLMVKDFNEALLKINPKYKQL